MSGKDSRLMNKTISIRILYSEMNYAYLGIFLGFFNHAKTFLAHISMRINANIAHTRICLTEIPALNGK